MNSLNRDMWREGFEEKVFKYVGNMLGNYGRPLYELTELQRATLEDDCKRLSRSITKEISKDHIRTLLEEAKASERKRCLEIIKDEELKEYLRNPIHASVRNKLDQAISAINNQTNQ